MVKIVLTLVNRYQTYSENKNGSFLPECVYLFIRGLCICKLLPCCVYAGSSMEFQCIEIQIKTEANSNDCPHDDKPSTGMFAVSDDIFSALSSSRGSVVS